jgi:gliding motility-associated-like protein
MLKLTEMNKLMKLIVILLSFQNLGLAQENTFYRKYNLSGMQGGLSMIETSDGGFVATGQHEANGSFGDCDTYVYRIDQCGNLVWMKLYGTEMQEGAKNIEELANGDFLIAGLAEFGGKGFMMRINNDGDVIWNKKFPLWMVTFTSESADGSILATAMGFGGGTNILKLDANGNLIWSKIINDIGSYGMFIKHLSNDDFVITSVDSGTSDFFAARLDPNGNVIWCKGYGQGWFETDHTSYSNKGLVDEANNSLVVTSPIMDPAVWDEDVLVTSLNLTNGNVQWSRRIGGAQLDQSRDVVKTPNGYAVLGHTSSYSANVDPVNHIDVPIEYRNILLVNLDLNGAIDWARIYGAEGDEKGISLRLTEEKGFLISAYTSSPFFGNADYSFDPLFIRTDSEGKIGCQTAQIFPTTSTVDLIATNVGAMSNFSISSEPYIVQVADQNFNDDYVCQECISIPEFTVNETSLCINEPFEFTNTTSVGLKCFQQWIINGETFSGEENISYTFPQPGVYQVQLVSSCSNENNVYTMDVVVLAPCDENEVIDTVHADSTVIPDDVCYVPNSFSPNSDEHNQLFKAYFANPENVSEFELTIYNRWGEVVYYSKDISQGWDGTYAKEEAMIGVYSWKLIFKYRNKKELKNGRVALIR